MAVYVYGRGLHWFLHWMCICCFYFFGVCMGCISNALDWWLCMCMAEDCIGFALNWYRFLMFLVCICDACTMMWMGGCVCVWQMIALVLHLICIGF